MALFKFREIASVIGVACTVFGSASYAAESSDRLPVIEAKLRESLQALESYKHFGLDKASSAFGQEIGAIALKTATTTMKNPTAVLVDEKVIDSFVNDTVGSVLDAYNNLMNDKSVTEFSAMRNAITKPVNELISNKSLALAFVNKYGLEYINNKNIYMKAIGEILLTFVAFDSKDWTMKLNLVVNKTNNKLQAQNEIVFVIQDITGIKNPTLTKGFISTTVSKILNTASPIRSAFSVSIMTDRVLDMLFKDKNFVELIKQQVAPSADTKKQCILSAVKGILLSLRGDLISSYNAQLNNQ